MSGETKKTNRKKEFNDPEGSIFEYQKEVRQQNGKLKTVTLYKVRKRYSVPVVDERGKPLLDERGKQIIRKREKKKLDITSKTEALAVRRQFLDDIKDEIEKACRTELREMQFFELLDFYEKEYVKAAEFEGGELVEGFREPLPEMRRALAVFREFFGDVPLSELTYSRIREFKKWFKAKPVIVVKKVRIPLSDDDRRRLKTKRHYDIEKKEFSRPRKTATVNRALARLRRIFNVGVQNQKLKINPFSQGDALISQASEQERARMLSFEEEEKLLAACPPDGSRDILRRVIVCALDTAMRQGEIFKLRWRDVDVENRLIYVHTLNTKTLTDRTVPMTQRLSAALSELRDKTFENADDDLVFGIATSCKVAWYLALRDASIEGLRFHDLRGTAITRMLQAGMSPPEVMKISGHTQYKTFLRYIKNVKETAQRAGTALDRLLEQQRAA